MALFDGTQSSISKQHKCSRCLTVSHYQQTSFQCIVPKFIKLKTKCWLNDKQELWRNGCIEIKLINYVLEFILSYELFTITPCNNKLETGVPFEIAIVDGEECQRSPREGQSSCLCHGSTLNAQSLPPISVL